MCSDEQHRQKIAALERINKNLELLISGRRPLEQTYSISDSQGVILDYKNRKHLYIYSQTSITLIIDQIIGNISISAKIWTNIDYEQGTKIFTSGTAAPINVQIRATDEVIA